MSDIAATVRDIDATLPDVAREVIRRHLDLSDPANERFLSEPDGREQHQLRWHQWGIVTHTRTFLCHFDSDVSRYLREWGLWGDVSAVLSEQIDGVAKSDLLRVAILLHDIGKFAARKRWGSEFHFTHHENLSGAIIRTELHLDRYGFTPAQIAYIARTAEDHFVLGLLRKRARSEGVYSTDFVGTSSFVDACLTIRSEHPDDYVEIGILFLGDSLAKADPPHGPEPALSQYEVNIVVARRYLEVVLGSAA